MHEHFHFTVDPGQELMRIDKFLMHKIAHATRTRIQYATDEGNVLVNTKVVKSSYKVRPGDEISILFPYPKREIELIPQEMPLDIIYEDNDVLVINKPAGLVVHPGVGNFTGTLINGLIYHFHNLPQGRSSEKDPYGQLRPGLVHRIDKDTSGLLLVAKNDKALTKLSKAFHEKIVQRKYTALVWGDLKEDEGTITGHIGRDLKDRKKMRTYPDGSNGRHAVTHYKVVERLRYVTVIECKLETGRTHQIRAHMAFIGHPIFNDAVYGGDKIMRGEAVGKYKQFVENCFKLIPRQALHAKSLGFIQPAMNKELYFESELPEDMKSVIEKWRKFLSYH